MQLVSHAWIFFPREGAMDRPGDTPGSTNLGKAVFGSKGRLEPKFVQRVVTFFLSLLLRMFAHIKIVNFKDKRYISVARRTGE